jgi:hypothetical protein
MKRKGKKRTASRAKISRFRGCRRFKPVRVNGAANLFLSKEKETSLAHGEEGGKGIYLLRLYSAEEGRKDDTLEAGPDAAGKVS